MQASHQTLFVASFKKSNLQDVPEFLKQLSPHGIKDLPHRLACRISALRNDGANIVQDASRCSHDSVMDYLLLHAKVSEMRICQELKWEINGNPGKVCIRTHKIWQGHQPKRTVIVWSAFGKLFKILMLDSDALSPYICTAIHVS